MEFIMNLQDKGFKLHQAELSSKRIDLVEGGQEDSIYWWVEELDIEEQPVRLSGYYEKLSEALMGIASYVLNYEDPFMGKTYQEVYNMSEKEFGEALKNEEFFYFTGDWILMTTGENPIAARGWHIDFIMSYLKSKKEQIMVMSP